MQTQLLKVDNESALTSYAYALSGNQEESIVNYNDLQGIQVDYSDQVWNKDIIDFHFTYDKAIILSDDTATIVDLKNWTDYGDDDKIQVKLMDGTCILTNIDKIKLINDDAAGEDSLDNYALSLVGDSSKVIHYDTEKRK